MNRVVSQVSIRPGRAQRRMPRQLIRLVLAVALVTTGLVLGGDAETAVAAGTPDISVSASTGDVLYGEDVTVTVTASNGTGTDGFNLSFQDVLPAGVSYVAGSATPAPTVIVRGDSTTALVWENVADLLAGTSVTFSYAARPDTLVYDAGDTIATAPQAFVNSDARFVPDFDADGDPIAGAASYTGNDATTTSTDLLPFRLTKSEPNTEGELLRGVHQHQTVFTLRVDNNLVNATDDFSVVDHLPAGLEFLGCGTVDNTTDAATTGQEYPGAGVINPGNAPAMGNPCPTPSSVTTVTTDPDGGGPMVTAVYTRVEWDGAALAAALGSDDLAATASFEFDYVAAIPMFENVQATLTDPTANLDNNTGPLTTDEQTLENWAEATGTYQSVLNAPSVETDGDTEIVTAEDISIHKSVDTSTFLQTSVSSWTLFVENSEYAIATGPITVTDTIPDGLDYTSSAPTEDSGPTVNGDGTLTVGWTLPGFTGPNDDATITFSTTTRADYRQTAAPVAANDSWTNTVDLLGDATLITDGAGGTTLAVGIVDASSAGQSTGGPTIVKEVSEPIGLGETCGDGSGLTFQPSLAGDFGPGDRVCWRLRVTFPGLLDTLDAVVQDFLPAGFEYTSWAVGANDVDVASTLGGGDFTDNAPVLTWDLSDVDIANVFEVVVATRITDPEAAANGDILSNLMKFRYENTDGSVFQARDEADVSWIEPQLTLSKGVIDVDDVLTNGGSQATGVVTVENGDVVTYEVLVANSGGEAALDVDVRDTLPPGITCTDIVIPSISDGGTCDGGNTWIEWPDSLNLTVPAGGSLSLTYDLTVPDTTTANSTLTNVAGVRTYEADTNDPANPRFEYVPSNNIDPGLTPNTGPADDDADIRTGAPTIVKTRTTGITEAGNNAGSEATIGETIDYTVTVTLPGGTTYYSDANPIRIFDDLPTRLDLVTSVAPTLTRNTVPVGLPDGFRITSDGDVADSVTVEFPLDGDDSYKTANGVPETFVLTFRALVLDDPSNTRGVQMSNTAQFDYETETGADRSISDDVNVRVVEPNLQITKADDDADDVVDPGQSITYTLTVTNPGDASHTSTAHDLVVVDTVPSELIVLEAPGDPAEDGDPIAPDGGIWNDTTRTITWNVTSLAPDASVDLQFEVETVNPLLSTGSIVNAASVEGTSLAGVDPDERDNTPVFTGYHDDTTNTLTAPGIPISKSGTPNDRTVGEAVTYTVGITIPADIVAYDVAVIDDIPAGMAYESLTSVTCDQNGGACSPNITSADVTTDGDVVSFFIGDLGTSAPEDRDVTITYVGSVDDAVQASAGATLTNTATLYLNLSDTIVGNPGTPPPPGGFDRSSSPATDDTNITEPSVSIDKDVNGQNADDDWRRAKQGDTLTFTLTVSNASGSDISDAYDLTIVDTPDTFLENYTFVSGSSTAGVVATDSDASDGGVAWSFPGPIAPGGSITIVYTMDVPAPLDSSDEVAGGPEATNSADVTLYYGVSSADRLSEPGPFRTYDDVTPDTVEIEVDLASIGDYVWHDVDGDGVQDPGEPPLAGVDVTVTYLGADNTFGTLDDEAVTVATDAGGMYVVDELPGGLYRVDVDETDPQFVNGLVASYDLDGTTVSPDGRWNGSLGEDEDKRDVDFGYTGDGSIGDTIWFDHDGDGTQDVGEGGISGVDVLVTWFGPDGSVGGGDDIAYPTATTDSNGNYVVGLLPAGNFGVEVQSGTLPTGVLQISDPDATVDGTSSVTLTAGEDDVDQDFGYRGTGSIGDTIYLDQDGDGGQDVGEPGLQSVTVQLDFEGADGVPGNGDDSTFTTTTDSNGNYSFPYLPPGDYTVTVTGGLPANVTNSDDPDGGADDTADLTLGNGENNVDQDFGYDADSVLGDRVWWDLDSDGIEDAGEPGLNGVTVEATGPNGLTLTTTTSGDGDYLFSDIPDGGWTVTITGGIPADFDPSFDSDGGTDETSDVTLATSDLLQDFGYAGASSIGDRIWLDRNADGVQDAGEPGIENVTVTLTWYGADDSPGGGDDVVLTDVTDATGNYLFPGLPPGEYLVTVDEGDPDFPSGVNATFDRDGTIVSPDGETAVTLPLSTDLVDVDFGYRGGAAVGDTVWFDRDGDGVQDADEPGISGVDVTIVWYGEDGIFGNADDESFVDTTDTDGVYGFDGLPPGDYDINVNAADLPVGMLPSYDPDGGLDNTSSLVLADGEVNLDQDFGYNGLAEIGDTIWLDLDGDGTEDVGEPGVPGQTVTVTWDGPDGPVTFTTVTDASGTYGVDGLPDGDYTVTVVGGIVPAAINTGDPDGGGDSTSDTTIAGGLDDLTQDFGYEGINSIGDLVWWDRDADGAQDPGEPGLDGVEVTLTWYGVDGAAGGGDDLSFVTTTDTDGDYLFEDLPDGSYSVAVTDGLLPARDTPTYDEDDGSVSPDLASVVVDLGVGGPTPVDHPTADFGVAGAGTIGDTIWLDLDGDGVLDAGEPGIAEVDVTLTWAGPDDILGNLDDVVMGTVETDADGTYLFEHLPAGEYQVGVARVPASLSSSADPDGGADDGAQLTLADGATDLDQDFGYVGDAAVGDLVWIDVDGDGLQDPNEPGIDGVTVTIVSPGVDGLLGTADDIEIVVETDEDGGYFVDGLPGAPTTVSYDVADVPSGSVPDFDLDGGDLTTASVALDPGDENRDVDFAVIGNQTLSGVVFDDSDGDGVQDPGEGPIPDVEITIVWDGPDGPVTLTTTTDDDGDWEFPRVPPGDYSVTMVVETLRDGDVATTPVTVSATVPVNGSATVEHGATPGASVGDRVWVDGNRDGVQDGDEPGLVGVTVRLLDSDGATVATATTDGNGGYLFEDLPPGDYSIVVDLATVSDDFSPSFDPDGMLDGRTTTTLTAGEDDRVQDFGFRTSATSTPATGAETLRMTIVAALLVFVGSGCWILSQLGVRRRRRA